MLIIFVSLEMVAVVVVQDENTRREAIRIMKTLLLLE